MIHKRLVFILTALLPAINAADNKLTQNDLENAVTKKDLNKVKQALQSNKIASVKDAESNQNLLQPAIKAGLNDIALELAKNPKIKLLGSSIYIHTTLKDATEKGYGDVVDVMLSKIVSNKTINSYKDLNNLLKKAIEENKVNVVTGILNNTNNYDATQILYNAIESGNKPLALAISSNAKVILNTSNNNLFIALDTSAEKGHADLVIAILNKVGNIRSYDKFERILEAAAEKNHHRIVKAILDSISKEDDNENKNNIENYKANGVLKKALAKDSKEAALVIVNHGNVTLEANKNDFNSNINKAIEKGYTGVLKSIFDKGKYDKGNEILKKALAKDSKEAALVIVQHNNVTLDASKTDFDANLNSAIEKGYATVVAALLDRIDKNYKKLASHLQKALNLENKDIALIIIQKRPEKIKDSDNFKDNLDLAIKHSLNGVVVELLKLNNSGYKDGKELIKKAFQYDNTYLVNQIITGNLKNNTKVEQFKKPNFVVSDGTQKTLLMYVIEKKLGINTLKTLLNKKGKFFSTNIDLDQADEEGTTALMIASRDGHLEVVKTLLIHKNCKINPNVVRNKDGKTALILASEGGHSDVVKELVNYNPKKKEEKVDIDAQDSKNNTALHLAIMGYSKNKEEKYQNIIGLLLEAEADVNLKNKSNNDNNNTPIALAQGTGLENIYEQLKIKQAAANIGDNNNNQNDGSNNNIAGAMVAGLGNLSQIGTNNNGGQTETQKQGNNSDDNDNNDGSQPGTPIQIDNSNINNTNISPQSKVNDNIGKKKSLFNKDSDDDSNSVHSVNESNDDDSDAKSIKSNISKTSEVNENESHREGTPQPESTNDDDENKNENDKNDQNINDENNDDPADNLDNAGDTPPSKIGKILGITFLVAGSAVVGSLLLFPSLWEKITKKSKGKENLKSPRGRVRARV